jgi:murein DD-endopeptidase MepM/ murein hydrolase activator NlpD
MPNIIVVSRHLRAPWTLRLESARARWAAAGVGLGVVVAIAGLGAVIGHGVAGADAALAPLRAEVAASREAVEQARAEAQRDVNAMAARLGELQAQANRLNALGHRLTDMGQFKGGEFDFSERPAMGGPENPAGAPTDLAVTIGSVEASFAQAEKQLDVLGALLESRELAEASRPTRAPAPGYISSGFGVRADPFTGGRDHHMGVDFDANIGDPVNAAANGIVSFSGWKNGYGNTVVVDHGDGYQTLYGHNQANLVRVGDVVRAGQQLAKVGSTGRSTGAHLHFEVHVNGRPVNPMAYLERIRG